MCGIGGIYIRKKTGLNQKDLKQLWVNLEDRGKHASGIAFLWQDADKVIVRKGPRKASSNHSMIDSMGQMVQYALLHTRYTTQGSVDNNSNNHPVVRDSVIMTHNGVIGNDWEMFKDLDIQPRFEVDTEALVAGIEEKGIGWTARKASGSMSIAWVNTENLEEVNLFTNGRNPLVIGELEDGSIVWASGFHHMKHYKPLKYFHAIPGVLYTLSPQGIRYKPIKGDWPQKPLKLRESYYGRVY